MKINAFKLFVLTAALALAGCDQSNNATSAASSAAATAADSKPVYTIDSVMLERPSDSPAALVVKASGTVRSSGWSKGQLLAQAGNATPDTMTYTFVALPPPKDTNVTQAMQPIDASLKLDNIPPTVKTIRVVAETNQTSAAVNPATDENATPAQEKIPGPETGSNTPSEQTTPAAQPQ